eukprot:TRINITY_DN49133_c0_g1_i6.p1 TRINITY_DN49133_c0_g1~~TRINITY_DN49133_c0_g1_i6.p1  ORF type:complete len:912 (+),score=250.15 TRINITY_DN49133_c0_g1_i6:167-2737(+)
MLRSLVGSEMCIRDRVSTQSTGHKSVTAMSAGSPRTGSPIAQHEVVLQSSRVPWKSLENQIALLTSMAMRSEDMERDLVDVHDAKHQIEQLVVELQDELRHAAGVASHATEANEKAVNALRAEEAHVERLRGELEAAHLSGSKQEEEALLALRHAEQYVTELRAQQEQTMRGLHVSQQQLAEAQSMVDRSKAERDALLKDLREMELKHKAALAAKAELEAQIAEQQKELDKGAAWREQHARRYDTLQREKDSLSDARLQMERDMEELRAELLRTRAEREALLKDMKMSEEAWDELRKKHGIQLDAAEEKRLQGMMRHVILRWTNSQLNKGLLSWRRWLWGQVRFQKILEKTWTRWSKSSQWRAYRHWQERSYQLKAQKMLLRRVCCHWSRLHLHYAWNSWVDEYQWVKITKAIIARSLGRLQNRQLWQGYNQWRTEFGWQAGRNRHLLNRASGRLLNRELGRGWVAWRSMFISQRNIHFMLERTTKRMLHTREFSAWHTWRSDYLRNRQLRKISDFAARRMLNVELAWAFTSLHDWAYSRHLMEARLRNKAGGIFKANAVMHHWQNRLKSQSFNTWRAQSLSDKNAHLKMTSTIARLRQREFSSAWNKWCDEYALYTYHRRILRYTAGKLMHGDIAKGFASLRLNARRERMAQEYELAQRQDNFITSLSTAHAISRWQNRLVTQVWLSWRGWATKLRESKKVLHWASSHILLKTVSRAYNQWMAGYRRGSAKRRYHQMINWVGAHFAYRAQACAFNSWLELYHNKIRIASVLRHTAQSWSNILVHKAYNTWYYEYSTCAEVKRITRWIVGHWARRELAIAYDQWHTDTLAWRVLHPLQKDRKALKTKVEYLSLIHI